MRTKKKKLALDHETGQFVNPNLLDPAIELPPDLPDPQLVTDRDIKESSGETRVSIGFQKDASGRVIWDRMRESTREQLKEILADPGAKKLFDVPGGGRPQVVDSGLCTYLYDAIGPLEAQLVSSIYKIPYELSSKVFLYSDTEKAMLAGPTAAVLNKYAPSWLDKFKEEISLVVLLVGVTNAKLGMMRELVAEYRGTKRDGERMYAVSEEQGRPKVQ